MSTYYLLVSTGGDTLSVDGTTILAYQAGSIEGPGGSFTLTPVFDTALISLPSEVEVWYSTDNVTFSRTAGIAGATWVNNVLSGTVGSSTTVYAKLYYSTGTPVTDENGAEVASVSTVIGGGTAPTFDGTPSASATNPTVGDSVSVLTYSASGTPTPTVTFEWFVDAVSQVETTDTFDTTGLSGGETLTCTVTASNGVSPDATANVDFGTVAADGLTLTIHDSFSGSGTLAGRTPDTVNNGNTWEIGETSVSISTSSGFAYRVSSGNNVFQDHARIDCGTTGPWRIEAELDLQVDEGVGVCFWNSDGTSSETTALSKIGFSSGFHIFQEVVAGAVTSLDSATSIVTPTNTYLMVVENDLASITSKLYDATGTNLIDTRTNTVASFSVTPTTKVGLHFGGSTTGTSSVRINDFKVYT